MAVKMRLTRLGDKKSPSYRIVVIDSRKARDGEYIDKVGHYDPTKQPAEIKNNDSFFCSIAHSKIPFKFKEYRTEFVRYSINILIICK